jgi:ArsR family transcriptional regulator, cadmium/lead-responsive transcriptional repressor
VSTTVALDLDTLTRVGEALADPTRRRVLVRLVAGPAYPAELAETLGVSRSLMSNHLACLRGCGFVTATDEGRRVRYELSDPAIADALAALAGLPLGSCPQDGRS